MRTKVEGILAVIGIGLGGVAIHSAVNAPDHEFNLAANGSSPAQHVVVKDGEVRLTPIASRHEDGFTSFSVAELKNKMSVRI